MNKALKYFGRYQQSSEGDQHFKGLSDDGRHRPKHVKASFILKIVALDETYSLFVCYKL
jgi:hypothetical protein